MVYLKVSHDHVKIQHENTEEVAPHFGHHFARTLLRLPELSG